MNIDYSQIGTQDTSRVIYSSDNTKGDLRNEIIRLASKNNSNIYRNMRVTSKQSRNNLHLYLSNSYMQTTGFLNVSVELEKKLRITNFKLNKLDERKFSRINSFRSF